MQCNPSLSIDICESPHRGEHLALIECLQCSGAFDESLQLCPGCGFPVPQKLAPAVRTIVSDSRVPVDAAVVTLNEAITETHGEPEIGKPTTVQKSDRAGWENNWIAAVCVFSGMMAYMVYRNGSSTSSSIANADDGRAQAITMAQGFVKEHLKSPTSASFAWSFDEYEVNQFVGGTWSVSGYVDAVNGFNANLRTRWIVKMKDEGTNWRLLSLDFP
jgi:hypothetical protein